MRLIDRRPYLDKGFVEFWDLSECNKSIKDVKSCVANIATLSYGNEVSKNPEALYEKLVSECHLSVLEFIRNPYFDVNGNIVNYSIQDSFRHKRQLIYCPEAHRNSIFTFKVKIPIFVARQLVRHRCLSILEMSRRYVRDSKVPFEFYIPDIEGKEILQEAYDNCVLVYKELLQKGVKPEVARSVIPVGAYTVMWVQFDKDCLQNFLHLRLDSHSQFEIREFANIISLLTLR